MTRDPYGAIQNGQGKGIPKVSLPLGTVVIRKHNGALGRFVKVRMGGLTGRRWMHYARWWWEKNRGPVPPGKIVVHVDGDQLNDDPKNFSVGTAGTKLALAHKRDPEWSRWQHRCAARKCADFNRDRGRIKQKKPSCSVCKRPGVLGRCCCNSRGHHGKCCLHSGWTPVELTK